MRAWTRAQLQTALEANPLSAPVTYDERTPGGSVTVEEMLADAPDNAIVYYKAVPGTQTYADDRIHLRVAAWTVMHLHKRKLDSIEQWMSDTFASTPNGFDVKQPETDYLADYYEIQGFAPREAA
jgi:hypothetical protein